MMINIYTDSNLIRDWNKMFIIMKIKVSLILKMLLVNFNIVILKKIKLNLD